MSIDLLSTVGLTPPRVPDARSPGGTERTKLPRSRRARTFRFTVAECKGDVTVGEYADGRPGEVFIRVAKQGSTLSGVMDIFSISVSLGLQHGVPLRTYVEKFTNIRFEPAGMTDDPDIQMASSLADYIFRRLALDYLPHEDRADLGIFAEGERTQPTLPGMLDTASVEPPSLSPRNDSPICSTCGVQMHRAGACHACPSCGGTTGCS
jgi:ribonucleoside-diphosphate reductase alpha chain